MLDTIRKLIEARVSARHYDMDRQLSDAQVSELVRLATLAPSAYNFQNWKFIGVRSLSAKRRLRALAYDQSQITEAPVTFIICGTLSAHKGLQAALQPSVDADLLDRSVLDSWVSAATESHQHDPQLQRDEAVRSASLAAMTLMLAAEGMGLSSGAMGGFDSQGVTQVFGLSDQEVPVMLVTVGYTRPGNQAQKKRKPLAEVLELA